MKYLIIYVMFMMIACSDAKQKYVVDDANIRLDATTEKSETAEMPVRRKIPYGFEFVRAIPKEPKGYTQGLLFHNGKMYESTGQYGRSAVRIVDHNTGKILKSKSISPRHFGEGIAVINDNLYMLTWTSRICFVFSPETLEDKGTHTYYSEGWGLTTYGESLAKSDGSHFLRLIEPKSFVETSAITVYLNGRPLTNLNELEYAEGFIFANIYMSDKIAVIEPETGEVLSILDFGELRDYERNNPDAEAFNGIAFNPESGTYYVTGKDWLHYFEVKILFN